MSRPSCPTCTKPIDPTHAPVARIRGAKIVTFCSAECAEGKPAAPDPAAPEPATPEPAKAVPVVPIAAKPPTPPKPARKKSATLDEGWGAEPTVEPAAAAAKKEVVAEQIEARVAKPVIPKAVASDEVDVALKKGKRKGLIAVLAAVVSGGAALAVFDVVSASNGESSTAERPVQTETEPAPEPEAAAPKEKAVTAEKAAPSAEVLHERAVATLAALRKSPSRRIERLSSMALARAGDADALAGVRKLAATEESSLNRIALAYALARSGDEEGRKTLTEGLNHDRRDVRIDASIGLLNIGDDAGRATLARMTNLRHYKISACEHLARAGDEKAKRILEKVYKESKDDPETKLRAAVAMGRAGDGSVAEYLRSTLADGRFQVGAADALAALGDKAAIEPLTRQLELNAMRVRAALALRRLGAKVDLEPLAVALTEDDEVTRVTAAEAVLILTGPETLSAHD